MTDRTDHRRTRQETAVAWTTTHAAELAGVGLPLIGGLVFTPWLDLVSAAVALLWAANEFRLRRTTATARQAAVTAAPPHRQLTTHSAAAPAAEGTGRKEAKA